MLVAVYGASGYQAKLVLTELSRQGIDAVLVGRDARRLREAASTVGLTTSPCRVAPLTDHAALVASFDRCDAVINCAGPFTRSGQAVVRAAIDTGCHYVDTAGEQLYVKTIFDTYAEEAERSGVTIVPATNDGCLPGDLIAHLVAEELGPIDEITMSHLIEGGGGPSRGSLRSVLHTADVFVTGGLTYDTGQWHTGLPARHTAILLPGASEPTTMAKLPLVEVVTIPRHVTVGHVESLVEAKLSVRLNSPLSPEIIGTLPEGPTEQQRLTQRFTYLIDAASTDGRTIRGVVQGIDTYGTTAVIAAEAARRLVTNGGKPGVLAPAQAFDPTSFLNFLAPHGLQWAINTSDQG